MDKSAVKLISLDEQTAVVGGYGVVFGGVDLEGETFTKDTDYMLDLVPNKPVLYQHGGNKAIKKAFIGSVMKAAPDDIGIWIEAELELSREYVTAVLDLVKMGRLGWSSGSISHLAERDGAVIKSWPIVEFSLTPTPAEPRTLGVERLKALAELDPALSALVEAAEESSAEAQAQTETPENKSQGDLEMSEQQEKQESPAVDLGPVLDAIKGSGEQVKAFDARLQTVEADNTPTNDPGPAGKAVNVVTDTEHWKYDHLSPGDLALGIEVLREGTRIGSSRRGVSDAMVKALAMRLDSTDRKSNDGYVEAYGLMRRSTKGIKSNEIAQSTLASYGDEWVGVAYGTQIWESIRLGTPILERQMAYAVPQPAGAETLTFPLEGADPTWYLMPQAADLTSNPGGIPSNTSTASKVGTAKQDRTMAKIAARVLWTGELEEDAVINAVSQYRMQLAASGMETLESLLIDGDTATGAAANINDIAGTPGGTEYWLGLNGYRKLALVTNTANSRDGGSLTEDDFLETVKLMGIAGKNAFQKDRTAFIMDLHTYWKALQIPSVKTRDVNSAATVENGDLTRIWGYSVLASENMHAPSAGSGYELKANSAGKIDQDTAGNNTTGSILAVRFDQWKPGYRRQMTLESTRYAAADATEIVAIVRFGMIYRDTEASAISYNLTV